MTEWNLPTIERASTLQQVHRTLREAIVHGSIAQGTHLREVSLANALGTSRATVREATRHLVQEGLVEHVVNRGNFVRALSPLDWLDVYVAREAIEVGVVTRLLQVGGVLDLTRVQGAIEELRRRSRGRARPDEHVIAADLRFHRELVALAGSPRLERAFETLVAETSMVLGHHPAYPWENYVRDHEVIFEALRRRDPRTPELVAEHLRLSARLIRDRISRDAEKPLELARAASA